VHKILRNQEMLAGCDSLLLLDHLFLWPHLIAHRGDSELHSS